MNIKFKNSEFKIVNEKISKAKAIDISGQLLLKNNYIQKEFISKMHKRDQKVTVAIGNGLAIPHGTDEAKSLVIKSGLTISVFPKGIKWDGKDIYCAIAIAAKGDDHIEFLKVIATIFSDESTAKHISKLTTVDEINNYIKNKYQEIKNE